MSNMSEHTRHKEIMELLLRVMHKFQMMESMPHNFGVDEKLYPREIHTIQAIGNYPQMNVTQLAETLGVTKGTISPVVTRLAKKKYVIKFKGGENNKDVLLKLTIKGEAAYHTHEMYHLQLHAKLFSAFEQSNPEHIEFLEQFLHVGEQLLDETLKDAS